MVSQKQRRTVPDFIRRGLRQGLGVGALVAAGYEFVEPFEEKSQKTASQWLTCFKWAAITLIVLTAPVLGKVAQISSERTMGTLAGGALGLLTVLAGREMMKATDQFFTAIISGLVAFGAVCLGHYLKLEYAGKLLAMTFILVIIGADERVDAFMVALTRCSGIILGVFLSVVLAVLIFPKSASHQATDNLSEALTSICTLCKLAWHSSSKPDIFIQANASSHRNGQNYINFGSEDSGEKKINTEEEELECEKVLMEVYDKLGKADELLPLAKREQYMFTFRGRWCFLPAIPFWNSNRWTVPAKQMKELATAMRKVSRVLWALHVTFKGGLDEEILGVLRQRFPPDTMSDLQDMSHQAFEDMAEAFPDDTILPSTNFHNFCKAVEGLIKISNDQRNALLKFVADAPPSTFKSGITHRPSMDLREVSRDLASEIQNTALQEESSYSPPLSGNSNIWDIKATSGKLDGANEIWFDEPSSTPVVSVEKIDGFSLTSDGYLSKVRWLSFQFLMQHLADEMRIMHRSLAVVLKMMPNALRSRERGLWSP